MRGSMDVCKEEGGCGFIHGALGIGGLETDEALKMAPLTCCETRISYRNVRTRFMFSPASFTEDDVVFSKRNHRLQLL